MAAMILAAGRGERLRPLTDIVPKALVEVQGECLIDRHLGMLARAGIVDVVINLGWLGEKIVAHVGSGSRFGLNVAYSPEFDNILETGGGICRALPMLGPENFWVVNADIVTDLDLPQMELGENETAHLVLVETPPHKTHGDFDLQQGRISNGPDRPYTFSGIAKYAPSFFEGIAPARFSVVPLLRKAADAGTLAGSVFRGRWEDIGTPERLAAINR